MKKALTLKQIYDEVANRDVLDTRFEVDYDGKDMILSPEIASLFEVDSVGRLHPLINTSGEITEASAAAIDTKLESQAIIKNLMVSQSDSFDGGVNDETESWRFEHKRLFFPALTNAGGDFASAAIVGLLAGYHTCMKLDYIFALGTDGAWDMSFAATSGLTGPTPMTGLASVANAVGPEWPGGLYYRTTAVAEAINLVIANGGNAITYFFAGQYWHEAP